MNKHDKHEKKEKDEPPYLVFRYCKKQCFACNECGYFWGPGAPDGIAGKPATWTEEKVAKVLYTADSVRESLKPKWDTYFAKLAVGQSPTWKCDQRTAELFCLSQWIMDELTALKCPDADRIKQQRFFNRKCRALDDLYELAAVTINMFLTGNVDPYTGRY